MAFTFVTQPRDEWFIPSAVTERWNRFDWSWGSSVGSSVVRSQAPQSRDWGVISEVPQTWDELEQSDPELFEPILETRPGRVPDPYPQPTDDVTAAQEDEPMAHDWGHLIRQGIGGVFGLGDTSQQLSALPPVDIGPQVLSPTNPQNILSCEGMTWSGGTPPKGMKVVNHCGVGVLRKIRRRRRRRMLTASDAADLATIVGIVGKGQMASSMINRTRS